MGVLTNISDLMNRLTGGTGGNARVIHAVKVNRIAGAAATIPIAGRWASLWRYDGIPAGGAIPTTVANPTNATGGSMLQSDPAGGAQLWVVSAQLANLNAGLMKLYDRLLHIGGLSGTNTSPQTVGGTLSRYTDGLGCSIWVEIYTILGTTITSITAEYVDDNDDTKTTTAVQIGGTGFREVTRWIQLPLAAGSRGVKAVNSVTLAGTTGTAGEFGVTIARQLHMFNCAAIGQGSSVDFIAGQPGLIEIKPGACVAMAWMGTGAAVPEVWLSLSCVEA